MVPGARISKARLSSISLVFIMYNTCDQERNKFELVRQKSDAKLTLSLLRVLYPLFSLESSAKTARGKPPEGCVCVCVVPHRGVFSPEAGCLFVEQMRRAKDRRTKMLYSSGTYQSITTVSNRPTFTLNYLINR